MPDAHAIDWDAAFDQVYDRHAPAVAAEVAAVFAPMTAAEIAAIVAHQHNPYPEAHPLHASYRPFDPSGWALPRGRLPADYLGFLAWSDGATWQKGEREFGCFGARHLREYLLHYHFPQYMPGAAPFGLDGGGIFGVFDLRPDGACGGVYAIGSGALDWDDAVRVAGSFAEFCQDTTRVDDLY
jgi:hypothetical protein